MLASLSLSLYYAANNDVFSVLENFYEQKQQLYVMCMNSNASIEIYLPLSFLLVEGIVLSLSVAVDEASAAVGWFSADG
jgi:hypothetical protein